MGHYHNDNTIEQKQKHGLGERETGGVVRKRLEDRWFLHDETTTTNSEDSAGFGSPCEQKSIVREPDPCRGMGPVPE